MNLNTKKRKVSYLLTKYKKQTPRARNKISGGKGEGLLKE